MRRQKFLGAGDETTRRVLRFVTALENVFREMSRRARVRDDARRLPLLEFAVILFQHFRRETKTVEPAAIRFEVVKTIAQTVASDRIEIVSPEERGAHACRNADALHRILDSAFAPAALFRTEPEFSRRAGRAAGGVFLQ